MEQFIIYLVVSGVLLAGAVWIIISKLKPAANTLDSAKQEALLREIQDLSNQVKVLEVQKQMLEQAKAQLQADQATLVKSCEVQFENMANKIFQQQKEASRAEINHLITPLNKQLEDFALRQAQDKANLHNQINRVVEANNHLQNITDDFVGALLHKPHFRGEWGEETLRQLLTDMGLQEGQQFFQQVVDETDKRPDFIVLLPNKQAVIIDAKTIWDKFYDYMKEENASRAAELLQDHIKNIKKTITELSTKKYRNGLQKFYNSINADMPDEPIKLVLMFVNPEAALTTALEKDASIVQEARAKNIALVSTATLISTLQIIESLWVNYTIEQSNEEIRNLAEKVVLDLGRFISQYQQVGKHLQDAHASYEQSISLVGQTNKTGILFTAQQLANLAPTAELSKGDKKILKDTGFDGTKKNTEVPNDK